ncbi:MAG: hypothetical protein FXF54_04470 [Kosmotoga sp.]|nr:MAG: hypothetical protein FXF54_04470 [Kosmotoga sp.]
MRKILIVLFLVICISGISKINLEISFSPVLTINNYPDRTKFYNPNTDDLLRYSKMQPLARAGLTIDEGNLTGVIRFEAKQDFSAFLMGRDWCNLPISVDSYSPFFDANFPRLGFVEYDTEKITVSFGRRKLKYGPGFYDLALSDNSPYYDHLWFDYSASFILGTAGYRFIGISSDRSVYDAPKTLLKHGIWLDFGNFRLSISEENLIYGVYPDLQDLGPFIIYHHTYQSHSNVIAILYLDWFNDDWRFYGEAIFDDFRLSSEGNFSNPTAIGWFAGVERKILDGEAYKKSNLNDSDYTLYDRQSKSGGLYLRYEYYRTSPYLYNRHSEIGKFVNPFRMNVMWLSSWTTINTFYGFKYGPDAELNLFEVRYEDKNFRSNLVFELLRKGDYDITDDYNPPFEHHWYRLVEPIKKIFKISVNIEYLLENKLLLMGNFSLMNDDEIRYYINLGLGKSFSF